MKQQEISAVNDANTVLLARPTNQLLNDFGSGKASPGSGSAAALLSLLSAKMVVTVCKISAKKDDCSKSHNVFNFMSETIESETEPKLKELFEKDAKDFEHVIKLRVQRDKASNPSDKAKFSRESLDLLQTATDYTFEVADISLKLMSDGISMYENGWHAIRGDSGVAISAAMSGVMSCIFIINLNLKTLKRRNYAQENMKRCQALQKSLENMQTKAFSCVTSISKESIESIQLELEINGGI